jgi:hypothetical protein
VKAPKALIASILSIKDYYVKGKVGQLNALISKTTEAWEDDTLTQEAQIR